MLNLDLDTLAVQSFETDVAGDPSQWDAARAAAPAPSDIQTCAPEPPAAYIATCCPAFC